jgi:hypothetical protein
VSRLVLVTSRRHEPDWLVDQLLANVEPWIDDAVVVDDRDRDPAETWGHEGQMRARQRQAGIDAGADWVLQLDPDERLEDRAGQVLRPLVDHGRQDVVYRMRLREMFTPTCYRVDGKWGLYRRTRLYPIHPGQQMSTRPIHTPAIPVVPTYRKVDLDLNLYHLKMIEPANRVARTAAYSGAEAQHGVRARSWAGMRSTAGMRLQAVPQGRRFTPGYTRPYVIGANTR